MSFFFKDRNMAGGCGFFKACDKMMGDKMISNSRIKKKSS